MKEYKISAISEGTVIDHITPEATFKVIEILNLDKRPDLIISVGNNMSSKQIGKKGIIKISGSFLGADDANKIALIAPNATLNIIKNFKVTEKKQLKIPEKIEGIVKCFNPNCITNVERVPTKFTVTSRDPLKLLCAYCERRMKREDIILL
ncbi:aspartate carbamoyltransferase regulatory subunit [Candidatus Woesearchaeota archaeon]|nr:aspartate carbamoyltransferase regulatory subunit [Candidatus Woesearchaeota archaeon]